MLADELAGQGYDVQFVLLSDANATDFASRASVPIFRDPTGTRNAWQEMEPGAVKHDTFVFSRQGARTVYRPASAGLSSWSADVRAAVEALGK
jgi:hypothetical protein